MRIHGRLLFLFAASCAPHVGAPSPSEPIAGPGFTQGAQTPHLSIQGERLAIHAARVESMANDNGSFWISVDAQGARLEPSLDEAYLVVVGERLAITGASSDPGSGVTTYARQADRAQALHLASALGVELEERVPPGHRLRAHFEAPESVAAGATSVPIRFVLENIGDVPITFLDGGRGRNERGRDERFSFELARDGVPLEPIALVNFGGLGAFRTLIPGATHAFELDLAAWICFDEAGTWAGIGAYEMEITGREAHSDRASDRWDDVLRAALEVRVDPGR